MVYNKYKALFSILEYASSLLIITVKALDQGNNSYYNLG